MERIEPAPLVGRRKKRRAMAAEAAVGGVIVRAPAGANRMTMPEAYRFLSALVTAMREAEAMQHTRVLDDAAELVE